MTQYSIQWDDIIYCDRCGRQIQTTNYYRCNRHKMFFDRHCFIIHAPAGDHVHLDDDFEIHENRVMLRTQPS